MNKIQSLESLEIKFKNLRLKNNKIVLTNGCFDFLHIGHVRLLIEAKNLGDILVVGLNSDSSVRELKGSQRPIIPEKERAEILSALACVDYIVIFQELSAEKIILSLKPDIYVKGADYSNQKLKEKTIVENYGGRTIFYPFVEGYSTSLMIDKIQHISNNLKIRG